MDDDDDPESSSTSSSSSVGRQLLLTMLDANNSHSHLQQNRHHNYPTNHNHFQPSNDSEQNIDFNNQYQPFMSSPTFASNSSFVVDYYDSNGGSIGGLSGIGGDASWTDGHVNGTNASIVGQMAGNGLSAMHLLSSNGHNQAFEVTNEIAEQSTWSLLMSALFYRADQFDVNWFNFVLALVLVMLMLTTAIGNLFVIVAILIEKNLRTVGNYLVLSLAIADLLVACLVMPLAGIYQILDRWILGILLCDIWTSADVFCCTASILHLLAIALDRYWAVTRVDYIRCQRNEKRILFMIFFVWMAACIISLAPVFGWKDANFESRITIDMECLISQDVGYQIFATCTTFYFPLILTLILYWKIYQVARKRIRRKLGNRAKVVLQHPSSSSSVSGSPGSRLLNQQDQHQLIVGTRQQAARSRFEATNKLRLVQQSKPTKGLPPNGKPASATLDHGPGCKCACHENGPSTGDGNKSSASNRNSRASDIRDVKQVPLRPSDGQIKDGQSGAHETILESQQGQPGEAIAATAGHHEPRRSMEIRNDDPNQQTQLATYSSATTTTTTTASTNSHYIGGTHIECPAAFDKSEHCMGPSKNQQQNNYQLNDEEQITDNINGGLEDNERALNRLADSRPLGGSIKHGPGSPLNCGKCRRTNWLGGRASIRTDESHGQHNQCNQRVLQNACRNHDHETCAKYDELRMDTGRKKDRPYSGIYGGQLISMDNHKLDNDNVNRSNVVGRDNYDPLADSSTEGCPNEAGFDGAISALSLSDANSIIEGEEDEISSDGNSSSHCASSSLINCDSLHKVTIDSGQHHQQDQPKQTIPGNNTGRQQQHHLSLCDVADCCSACNCYDSSEVVTTPAAAIAATTTTTTMRNPTNFNKRLRSDHNDDCRNDCGTDLEFSLVSAHTEPPRTLAKEDKQEFGYIDSISIKKNSCMMMNERGRLFCDTIQSDCKDAGQQHGQSKRANVVTTNKLNQTSSLGTRIWSRLVNIIQSVVFWRQSSSSWVSMEARSSLAGASSIISQQGGDNYNSSTITTTGNNHLIDNALMVDQHGRSSIVNAAAHDEFIGKGARGSIMLAQTLQSCPNCQCLTQKSDINHLEKLKTRQQVALRSNLANETTHSLDETYSNRDKSLAADDDGALIATLSSANMTIGETDAPTTSSNKQLMVSIDMRSGAGGRSGGAITSTNQNVSMSMEGVESKRERKAAKTLSIITGVFVMCWLPFFIMAITMPLLELKPHKYVFSLLLWLGYANSMLNPIIYTIFSPDFRKAFKHLLCGKEKRTGGSGGGGSCGNSNNNYQHHQNCSQKSLMGSHDQPTGLGPIMFSLCCYCCLNCCRKTNLASQGSSSINKDKISRKNCGGCGEAIRKGSRRPTQASGSFVSTANNNTGNLTNLLVESQATRTLDIKPEANSHSGITNDF